MIFITRKLSRLSKKTKLYLRKNLTILSEGERTSYMSDRLRATNYTKNHKDVAVLVKHYDKYIAWALISFLGDRNIKSRIMVYVLPIYRRQGLGTILVKKCEDYIKRHNKKDIWVIPWDGRSSTFFKSLGFKKTKFIHEASKKVK